MKMSIKQRRARRKVDAPKVQARNRARKVAERDRRDARMMERLRSAQPPYTPALASWLSSRLDKPSSRITPEDVTPLLK